MLSDLRFVIGAILATAVLAVSSFALYATAKMMQQAKVGVIESSRTPPFDAGTEWHRKASAGASSSSGETSPGGAVSVLLNTLPKSPSGTAPAGAPESTPEGPPTETPPEPESAPAAAPAVSPVAPASEAAIPDQPAQESPPTETVTGTVSPEPPPQAHPAPVPVPAIRASRKPASAPARRITIPSRPRAAARERDEEPRAPAQKRRTAVQVEQRERAESRQHRPAPYEYSRRSLYGGNYWQPFGQ